jgi:class 3 adenylate cyclase
MTFDEVLDQVRALLQQRGRVTYRALQRRFELDEEYLADLKGELIRAEGVAVDEDGEVLVWAGDTTVVSSSLSPTPQTPGSGLQTPDSQRLEARREGERRQMTVMFCDLVGSTALSTQLDPEELRAIIQAYRATCTTIIRRFDGYLAKYIGDGLLIYFGYPRAHEDDAQRAVRAGLGIIEALQEKALEVRIGIHTGLVVAGEMGTEDQPEPLAIVGETPQHRLARAREGRAQHRRDQPGHLPARAGLVRVSRPRSAGIEGTHYAVVPLPRGGREWRAEPLCGGGAKGPDALGRP